MARAVHAAGSWERYIYAWGHRQLQTASHSPHITVSTKLAPRQQSPGVEQEPIPSVVHRLHLGVGTGQMQATSLHNPCGISTAGPTTSTHALKLPFVTCSKHPVL